MRGRAALPEDVFIVQAVSPSVGSLTGVAIADIVVLTAHVLEAIWSHYRSPGA